MEFDWVFSGVYGNSVAILGIWRPRIGQRHSGLIFFDSVNVVGRSEAILSPSDLLSDFPYSYGSKLLAQ